MANNRMFTFKKIHQFDGKLVDFELCLKLNFINERRINGTSKHLLVVIRKDIPETDPSTNRVRQMEIDSKELDFSEVAYFETRREKLHKKLYDYFLQLVAQFEPDNQRPLTELEKDLLEIGFNLKAIPEDK